MSSADEERRATGRANTWRKAIVSLFSGHGSMIQGTAVDLSPDGLRITAPVALPGGSEVEVFLPARPEHAEEAPLTVVGRIVWTAPQEGGLHAMGIRLYEEVPPTEAITSRAGAEAMIARVREELRVRAEGGAGTIVRLSPVAESRAPSRHWGRWLAAALLLLLLFLGSYAVMRRLPLRGARAVEERPPPPPEDLPALDHSQRTLLRGDSPDALEEFQRLAQKAKTPAARMIAALGAADALRMQGRVQEAVAAVRRALDAEPAAPKAWRQAAAQFRDALAKAGGAASAPPLLMDAVGLLRPGKMPAPEAAPAAANKTKNAPAQPDEAPPHAASAPSNSPPPVAPTSPAEPGLRIEVDKSDFVLTVLRGNAAVASFPVGVGMDNTTPEGDFVIANKLLDPDWYNHGESVKAGDPRNPLGRHWMGLGNERGPTSYGIHEATAPATIGANFGRGCIRMRPADATELFRLCGLGTPVRIVE